MPRFNIGPLINKSGVGVSAASLRSDSSRTITFIGELIDKLQDQINKLNLALINSNLVAALSPLSDPFYFSLAVGIGVVTDSAKMLWIREVDGNCIRLERTNATASIWDINVKPTGSLVFGGSLANADVFFVSGNKQVGVNTEPTVSGTGSFHATGDTARIVDASNTPANSAAAGNDGEVRMDNNYIYVHTGGSWRRAAIATF